MDQDFQYAGSPLDLDDSFRLIQLEPGQLDEPVQIHLVNSRLCLKQHYEALSYTWGNPSILSQISVVDNDAKFKTAISITTNCHSALRRLRCLDRPRTLWVDAICINQSSIQERNHQLGLMTRIYQGASRVLVYLGESDHDSDVVMEWIRELDAPSDFGRGSTVSWPSRHALKRFFSRHWFRRVWVLQEVKFARLAIVICGSQETDWESFSTFHRWSVLRAGPRLPYSVVYASKAERQGLTAWLASLTYAQHLARVLQGARLCEATDPRDKVFAVVPLAYSDYEEAKRAQLAQATSSDENDENHILPGPRTIDVDANYEHSAYRVFTNLSLSLLRELGLDELLSMVHTDRRRGISGLPSWVPDWSVQSSPVPWGMEFSKVYAGFQTREESQVGSIKPTWRVQDITGTETAPTEQTLLYVPAVRVGTITKAGAVCCVDNDFFPIGQWKQLTAEAENYELSENSRSPFVSVLFGGRNTLKFETVVNYIREYNGEVLTDKERKTIARLCWRSEFWDRRSGLTHKMEDEFTIRVDNDDNSRLERIPLRSIFADKRTFGTLGNDILDRCDGKRFVVLDTGLMGLTVGSADLGDQVWVLENVTRPFVFRKAAEPDLASVSNTSTFIGPCWVNGAMFGEIWGDVIKEQEESRTLEELIIV